MKINQSIEGILRFKDTDHSETFFVGSQEVWLPNEPTYGMPDSVEGGVSFALEGNLVRLTKIGEQPCAGDPKEVGSVYRVEPISQ